MLARHLAVCLDYDGTLARDGALDDETVCALERLKSSGRRLLMVTGRQLDDLRRVCRRIDLFDRIVAENGALLFTPETGDETPLSDPPPAAFVDALRRHGIEPLSVGRGIVATCEPHDAAVLQTIRELGLALQVIFNKGAVMVLAPGVDKASGAEKALTSLGLSPHNAIAVGDAENDRAMLAMCQVAVAVANALPSVKADADIVTRGDHGAGVRELIDELLSDDLASRVPNLCRHRRLRAQNPTM
jgi:hydroxymethylpyrimidine pyrophosphatase-like HAD family hydrolase